MTLQPKLGAANVQSDFIFYYTVPVCSIKYFSFFSSSRTVTSDIKMGIVFCINLSLKCFEKEVAGQF